MIKLGKQGNVDIYFSDEDHLSQSKIKLLLKSVSAFNNKKDEKALYYTEKGHFIIGSGVDVHLTCGKEEFKSLYHIVNSEKPADKGLSIITYLLDNAFAGKTKEEINNFNYSMLSDTVILEACDMHEYQKRYGDAAKLKAVAKMSDFFDESCLSNGKQMITLDDFQLINRIVDSFKKSEFKWLFDNTYENDESIEIHFQVPIYGDVMSVKTKVLLDILVVDHNRKIVIPIDIKTMNDPISKFVKSFFKFRYDIQGSFYTEHVIQLIENTPSLKDYKVSQFSFLVESTSDVSGAAMFTIDDEMLDIGKYGYDPVKGVILTDDNNVKSTHVIKQETHGFIHGIELYKWHLENGFDQDRIIKENNNQLVITKHSLVGGHNGHIKELSK